MSSQSLLSNARGEVIEWYDPVQMQLGRRRSRLLESRLHQLSPFERVLQSPVEIVVMSGLKSAPHEPVVKPDEMEHASAGVPGCRLDQQNLSSDLSNRQQTCLDEDHLPKRLARQFRGIAQVEVAFGGVLEKVRNAGHTEFPHDLSDPGSDSPERGYRFFEYLQQGFHVIGERLRHGHCTRRRCAYMQWRPGSRQRRVVQQSQKRGTPVCPRTVRQELIIDQQGPQLVRYAALRCGLCPRARAFNSRKGQPRKPAYGGIIITATLEFQTHQTPQELFPRIRFGWTASAAHWVADPGDCRNSLGDVRKEARTCNRYHSEVLRHGGSKVRKRFADSQVCSTTARGRVRQNGHVLTCMVRMRGERRIAAMVGGDEQDIVMLHRPQQLGNLLIKTLQSDRIASHIAAVAEEHVKVDQVGEQQPFPVVGLDQLDRLLDAFLIAVDVEMLREPLTRKQVVGLADADDIHTGLAHLGPVSYTHLRAHETRHDLVCRL